MKFNKTYALFAVLLVIFIAGAAGGVWFFFMNRSNNSARILPTTTPVVLSSSYCGLIIDGPNPNSINAFPLTIHGAVNNNNATALGCSWTMFEGQAGTAQLYYWDQGTNNWVATGTPSVIPVTNWMSLGPVPFVVIVNFNNGGLGLNSGNLMKVTFTEENPSGEGTPDSYDLPLVLQ